MPEIAAAEERIAGHERCTEMPRRLDQEYWLGRAEEARTVAAQFDDHDRKRIMLGIAEGYERMARVAERLALSRKVLTRF